MQSSLADDPNKNIVVYVNDFYPEFARAFTKLSEKLDRPLRGFMLVDADRKASGKYLADKEGFFEEIVVDFSDDVALTKTLKTLENNLLLVSCDSERSQLYFKRVIPHVPYVNTPTESSLDYCTDKGKMRDMLLAYEWSISPRAVVVSDASLQSVNRVSAELTFPLITKPTNLAASMLVNKVNNESELSRVLQKSFRFLEEIYSNHRGLGDKTIIVEEFIEGDLYSTDIYSDSKGRVYVLPFIHFQNGAMVGMEGYQVYRTETYLTLREDVLRKGIVAAEKAVHAVGLRSSVAHVELFYTGHDWKIIELGARPGGWRQETYQLSYGIDHALNELLVKIGREPEMPETLLTHSATFRIHAPKQGMVRSIVGLEKAREYSNLHTLHVNVKPGDKVLPSKYGGEAMIEGLVCNTNYEQLNEEIAAIRACISVDITQIREE